MYVLLLVLQCFTLSGNAIMKKAKGPVLIAIVTGDQHIYLKNKKCLRNINTSRFNIQKGYIYAMKQ